ncbi:lateral signaling target protein 2 homolog [Physella acuta]|uniref:lateral signaling target protein 2 homolog n=1 Tax=Physella acuta TaxID=109671 RepID=UPI0027DB3D2F|nr:lateral signaling target protein 2 homolog [Physella acuta]
MNSLRKWLYRPKRSDPSLLAQFYFADEELNLVAAELDSFEGRKDPERCTALVNQLRACQARVLNVISQMMDETVKYQRASRDFRVKFPDDVIQENLAGQLWFGAECLAAGSSIMNREVESACMRPLARALTKNLDSLRTILRDQCLCNIQIYTEEIKESLIIFDKLFAEFELSYVSAMVPVKTAHEYDMIQEITVLFSETVQRALKIGLLTRDMIDEYDPALMFTIPRLAIVCGVLIFNDGPLNPDNDPWNISEMFRPFQTLLLKIRELLGILSVEELNTLERALCSQEEPSFLISLEQKKKQNLREERRKIREERKNQVKEKREDSEGDDGSVESELTALEIAERLEALALNYEAARIAKQTQTNEKPEPDAQSSHSSTSSSSPLLSEGDTEGSIEVEVVKSSESDQSEDLQLQRFTNQLYFEANFDSHNINPDVTQIGPVNAFIPDSPFLSEQMPNGEMALPTQNGCVGESAASNRANFARSKCDSNDSGRHSEVVSNSGSMFTISSSDSNQLLGATADDSSPTLMDLHEQSVENHCSHDKVHLTESFTTHEIDLNAKSQELLPSIANEKCLSSTKAGVEPEKASYSEDIMVTPLEEATALLNSVSQSSEATPLGHQHSLPINNGCTEILHANTLSPPSSCAMNSIKVETVSPVEIQDDSSHVDSTVLVHNSSCNVKSCNLSEDLDHITAACAIHVDTSSDACQAKHTVEDNVCDNSVPPCNSVTAAQRDGFALPTASADLHSLLPSGDHPANTTAQTDVEVDKVNNNIKSPPVSDVGSEMEAGSHAAPIAEQQMHTTNNLAFTNLIAASLNPSNSEAVNRTEYNLLPPGNSAVSGINSTSLSSRNQCDSQDNTAHLTQIPPHSNSFNHSHTTDSPRPSQVIRHDSTKNVRHKKPGVRGSSKSSKTENKRQRRGESGTSSSHSSALPRHAKALMDSHLLDAEYCNSSETSSYTSDCGDQEEIALAIQAAENATRQQVRARFRSSSDMIHRLFVCISGVADQLQTNFAGDLRNILRAVFDMNCSVPMDHSDGEKSKDTTPLGAAYRAMSSASHTARRARSSSNQRQKPPVWIPDEQCNECMSCQVPFTFVRRRHHCRNCGKIFCSRCSSSSVPLPHFGEERAVRVCNRCYMFRVTPFTTRPAQQ